MTKCKFTSILAGLLGLTLTLSAAVAADAPFTGTTLQAYLERAQESNPELEAFEARYQAAVRRVPQVSSLPDPRIQVTHFVESVQTRTGTQANVIMLSQAIPWFGKLGTQKTTASAEAEALWYAYQSRQLALVREVSDAFFEYGYTESVIDSTRETLDLLRGLEPIVEERVRGGGELNPLLRLQVEIGRVEDRFRSLEQQRVAQSARLAGLLALPPDDALPSPTWERPPVDEPDREALIAAVRNHNPELAMLDRRIESAEARRVLARLAGRPDFTVGVNYIQLDPYVNSTLADAGRDPWGVTVGVSLPIWRTKYRAAREEAQFMQDAAERERHNRENILLAELTAGLVRLEDANRRLSLYGDELLDLARQALENARASYENGRATILDVIDSERSLLELELLFWRAGADVWQRRVTIQALANQPIAGAYTPIER